jgi:hypothetical protein
MIIIIMLVSGKIHLSTKFYVDQVQKKTREISPPSRDIPKKEEINRFGNCSIVLP